jgi:hypothetical protein
MFQTKIVGKIKTNILYSANFLQNRDVYDMMWKIPWGVKAVDAYG